MRLNIEDEAFSDPRYFMLALKLGNNFKLAIGTLNFLWRNSQKEKIVIATGKRILQFLVSNNKQDIVDLVECGYLIDEGNDTYLIVGNQKQIDGISEWYDQKSLAGKASAEAKRLKREQEEIEKQKLINDRSTEVNDRSTEVNDRSTEVNDRSTEVNEGQRKSTQEQEQEQEQETKQNKKQEQEEKKERKKIAVPAQVQRVIDIWNEYKSPIQAKATITADRVRRIKKRLEDFPDEASWINAVKYVAAWDHANGKSDKYWVADIKYLTQDNSTKCFESAPPTNQNYNPKRITKNNCQTVEGVDYASEKGVIKC
jgi:hypothetical protein